MGYQIPEETIDGTTRCPRDFACLTEGGPPRCEVDRAVQGNGVFVREPVRGSCPYQMSFGNGFICHCPTRIELHDRYEV